MTAYHLALPESRDPALLTACTQRVMWPLCSLEPCAFLDQGQHAVGMRASDQQGAALWGLHLLLIGTPGGQGRKDPSGISSR